MKDPRETGPADEPSLTLGDLVEQLVQSIPELRPRFDRESWQYEMPDGSWSYYGVVETFLTVGCIVPGVLDGDDTLIGRAVRFVERMLASADDEVQGAAAIAVGERWGWSGFELAEAVFRSEHVSVAVKDLVWQYASTARDTPERWRSAGKPY